MSLPPKSSIDSRTVISWRHSGLRDRLLTRTAATLARTRRVMWYAETLVLSARYQQWLLSTEWGRRSQRESHREALWAGVAAPYLQGGRFTAVEFGVAGGLATRWWASTGVPFEAWHGFDTFEGLPQAWMRSGIEVMAAGVFAPAERGIPPIVSTAYPLRWHRGLIQETLPRFERPDHSLFALIDVDLLEPSIAVLDWLRQHGRSGDLIYFDEAFDPWNEGLALRNALAAGLQVRGLGHTGSALLVALA